MSRVLPDCPVAAVELLRARRSVRDRTGLHAVEGLRNFVRCFDHGIPIRHVIYSEALLRSSLGQKLLRRVRRSGTRVTAISPERFRRISKLPQASGVVALVRQHATALPSGCMGLWVGLEQVQSPGNLGTLLRTLAGAGGRGLVLLGEHGDAFDPAVVRASMGSLFSLQIVRTTHDEVRAWSAARGGQIVGADGKAALRYDQAPLNTPTLLLLGHERRGLSAQQRELCTTTVGIPLVGDTDSLNVSVAAGVLLFEVQRQRGFAQKCSPHSGQRPAVIE